MSAVSGVAYTDRHVLPVGDEARFDREGFLAPQTDEVWFGRSVRPSLVTDLVHDVFSFALLAAGGVGKSTVLRLLAGMEPGSQSVDLIGLDKRGIRETLREAATGSVPVYVDSLDVVALEEPAVFDILAQLLRDSPARDVPWRLACRPAAWSPTLASSLRTLPGFAELRLLPLTRDAAREVVASTGADADRFLEVLTRANLGRLSVSPMQLVAMVGHWQLTGALPATPVVAISDEVDRLLRETDPSRPPPRVATDRQRRLAGRLAAVTVFCGVTRYSRTATGESTALCVGELPSDPEPDEPGTPSRPSDFEQVLGTALFDPAPGSTVEFRHQLYAEYLAAEYLSRRGVTRAQLPSILGTTNEVIPGPLVGVAAWLACLCPDLCRDLVTNNAGAFLQSGVELPDATREVVVEGLLAKATAGDIDPAWGTDLSILVHSSLSTQLASRIGNGITTAELVWWVAQLARAGGCGDLVAALLQLALDPSWPDWAVRPAIAAIDDLGTDADRARLRPLLYLDETGDPDDEVLSAALDAMYPSVLGMTELLGALRPRRNENLVGGYLVLMGELAQRIRSVDLPLMLAWAAGWIRQTDNEGAYGRLIGQLLDRGWVDANDDSVLGPLADLVAALDEPPALAPGPGRTDFPWVGDADGARRRRLAVAVAERLDRHMWPQLTRFGLVQPADTDRLVDELPVMPTRAQGPLAVCVADLLDQPTARQANRILSLSPDHPLYEPTRWWREPVAVDSPQANRSRERLARERTIQAQRSRRAATQVEPIRAALEVAQTDVTTWWRVAQALGSDVRDEGSLAHDLTKRPGWALLDPAEQRLVLDLGVRYLEVHTLTPARWLGRATITLDQVYPDWCGVYLLTTLARHDPELVGNLPPATWARWAKAIVAAWNYDRDGDAGLRGELVDLSPPDGRAEIIAAAFEHLDALASNDHDFVPRPLFDHLFPEMAPHLAERITARRYSDRVARPLLDLLTTHTPDIALATCRQLYQSPTTPLAAVALRKLAALDPNGVVDRFTTTGTSAEDMVQLAPCLNFADLDDHHLGGLARVLLDLFPIANDPPLEVFVFASDRHETRRVRNRVLGLLGERGQVDTLNRLLPNRPGADRAAIRYHLRAARLRAAHIAHTRPTPQQLLALLGRADARLVRHADDLLQVVIDHLHDLQHEIRHGAHRDLWNTLDGQPPRPKPEDDISDWLHRHLQSRLGGGSVVDREIQVERRRARGMGTRVDLTVTATSATHPVATVRLMIEAKLISNDEVTTALPDQLVHRYLIPAGLHHGIYLVYWVDPAQRPTGGAPRAFTNQADLLALLTEQQSTAAGTGMHVRPMILDISQPM